MQSTPRPSRRRRKARSSSLCLWREEECAGPSKRSCHSWRRGQSRRDASPTRGVSSAVASTWGPCMTTWQKHFDRWSLLEMSPGAGLLWPSQWCVLCCQASARQQDDVVSRVVRAEQSRLVTKQNFFTFVPPAKRPWMENIFLPWHRSRFNATPLLPPHGAETASGLFH